MAIILREDDLQIGQTICIHGLKNSDEPTQLMGQAMKIQAICLPFVVCKPYAECLTSLTLDFRYLNLMKVSKEFPEVQAIKNVPTP